MCGRTVDLHFFPGGKWRGGGGVGGWGGGEIWRENQGIGGYRVGRWQARRGFDNNYL